MPHFTFKDEFQRSDNELFASHTRDGLLRNGNTWRMDNAADDWTQPLLYPQIDSVNTITTAIKPKMLISVNENNYCIQRMW